MLFFSETCCHNVFPSKKTFRDLTDEEPGEEQPDNSQESGKCNSGIWVSRHPERKINQ